MFRVCYIEGVSTKGSNMNYKDLDSNFTYDCRIETGSVEESERLHKWFREHGHRVMRPWSTRDYIIVRGSSYKIGSICEHHFPGMAVTFTMISEPVGFERGEWVVMRRIGIVGQVSFEYGYNGREGGDNTGTGVNVSVGSSTWSCGWAATNCVRLSDLPADTRRKLRAIGKRQAAKWELLHRNMADASMVPDRQKAFDLVSEQVPA